MDIQLSNLKTQLTHDEIAFQCLILNQAEIHANIGTFSWNLSTRHLTYSDNFYRILGCEPNEFEPNVDYFNEHFLHPDDRGIIEQARKNVLKNMEADSWQYRIYTKQREIKHIKAISKIAELDGQKYLIGTIQDITKEVLKLNQLQKRQEELRMANIELKTSLRVIEHAESSAGMGHWHVNMQSNVFTFSENLQKISGLKLADEFAFEHVLNIIHPDDRQHMVETTLRDYRLRRTSISVFRIIRPDGIIKYIKATSNKLRIHKYSFIVGIAQDITDMIEKEMMLEEKNLQLERQNDELASFNHMASHDLQEPIRKIQILSKMILDNEGDKLSEASLGYFQRMEQSARRMQLLINDLLEYSRANNPQAAKAITNLNHVLQECLNSLSEDIASKNASIHAGKLPSLWVIPVQITQVFINLLENALKYSKADTHPIIEINAKIVPSELVYAMGMKKAPFYHCITISDNGIGFEQQYAQKIFELFQRLHPKTSYNGTGIGLTICKKVMQNHHGFIIADSKPGQGSTFSLYFPYQTEEDVNYM